jgi:IS605 OrfB family transposase
MVSQFQRSYNFKIDPMNNHHASLQHFQDLVQLSAQQLLQKLWTENWIERLSHSSKKAYKVVDEEQVELHLTSQLVYLPSRFRRGVAERVGRILRSQQPRKDCFYSCLIATAQLGLEGNLNRLTKQVALSLQLTQGRFWRHALIRQTLRLLRRWYFKYRVDVWTLCYTDVVQPVLHKFIFPYGPDDDHMLRYCCNGQKINYEVKLPVTPVPLRRSDWLWIQGTMTIPQDIQQKIKKTVKIHPHRPLLRQLTLKGGLTPFVLQFPWEYESKSPKSNLSGFHNLRALSVDLGLVNLATLVVHEAGYQITPPTFIKLTSKRYRKIERFYKHSAKLQRKLDRYPRTWCGQGRRFTEYYRLRRKLDRYRNELTHTLCNQLLSQARFYNCKIIILENLGSVIPPKGAKQLSRRLSNWLRGRIPQLLAYKCPPIGLHFFQVNPWGTSSYCPRCGLRGLKIRAPNDFTVSKTGRFFHCPSCGFTADRDYVGALNIYRIFRLHTSSPKSRASRRRTLHTANPVLYQSSGTPLNHPSGGSVTITHYPSELCVLVTGGPCLS